MSIRNLVAMISIVAAPSISWAAVDDVPPILKGRKISVRAWEPHSKTYDVEDSEFSAQGPNYATVKDLAKAVKALDRRKLQRQPDSVVGNEYVLDEDLQLQSVVKTDAIRERAAQKKKKPSQPAKPNPPKED